jgi:predicted nuclease of predicted toxin-antitoxin system
VKLLLDQQLSRTLVVKLEPFFPGTSHVILHNLEQSRDEEIWEFARVNGFTIVTKDDDYQLLSFMKGHPPKVLWLISGNGPTQEVLDILLHARTTIEAFCNDIDRSLMILP